MKHISNLLLVFAFRFFQIPDKKEETDKSNHPKEYVNIAFLWISNCIYDKRHRNTDNQNEQPVETSIQAQTFIFHYFCGVNPRDWSKTN